MVTRSSRVAPGGAAWSGYSSATPPESAFLASTSGRNLLDQYGQPWMMRGYTAWAGVVNAGRYGGNTWAEDITYYCETVSGFGVNATHLALLGHTQNNGPYNDGRTWDGVSPWASGVEGNLNESYWTRVDWWVSEAERCGITLFLDFAYQDDLDTGALSGATTTECRTYGENVATRYASAANVCFSLGGDYFGYSLDTNADAIFQGAVTDAGYDGPLFVQYYAESTSRTDSEGGGDQDLGGTWATIDYVYTYNVTYLMCEVAYQDTPALPVVWGDGKYDDGSSDRTIMRNMAGWALTSGALGVMFGAEATWGWPSGWQTALGNSDGNKQDIPTVEEIISGYAGWQDIVPDISSSFITGGRQTKASQFQAGGSGGEYTGGNEYVTGGRNSGGTLAIIYLPDGGNTITVATGQMQSGYTATWVDPTSGDTTAGTPGTTFQRATSNDAGGSDWLLVLEG